MTKEWVEEELRLVAEKLERQDRSISRARALAELSRAYRALSTEMRIKDPITRAYYERAQSLADEAWTLLMGEGDKNG